MPDSGRASTGVPKRQPQNEKLRVVHIPPPAARRVARLASGIRHRFRCEAGQVAVLVALIGTALVSMLALAVDAGIAYQERRSLQTSVDAAALAGAIDLAEQRGQDAAENSAVNYVNKNSAGPIRSVSVGFPGAEQISVEAKTSRQTWFARLLGHETMPVGAKATASTGLAGQVNHLVPIIVPLNSVAGHIGPANGANYTLGDDRPMESLSITYSQSGSRVTYTVAYVNTKNNPVNLEMWSPIPGGATYTAGSATGGGIFNGSEVRWQWSNVASGDRRSADFSVDFGGPVNPRNVVYAQAQGGQVVSAATDDSQRGFFWLVDFDEGAHGTPDFSGWIRNGYPDLVGIGQVANGTGVRSSLSSALSDRMASDPAVVLPLYDYTEGGGSGGAYHVAGFAEFVITGFDLSGAPKTISGYFTEGTVTSGTGGGDGVPDFGIKAVWLSD